MYYDIIQKQNSISSHLDYDILYCDCMHNHEHSVYYFLCIAVSHLDLHIHVISSTHTYGTGGSNVKIIYYLPASIHQQDMLNSFEVDSFEPY